MRWRDLPDQVKAQVSEKEWLWLSNEEQNRFLTGLVEPEGETLEEFVD